MGGLSKELKLYCIKIVDELHNKLQSIKATVSSHSTRQDRERHGCWEFILKPVSKETGFYVL